MGASGDVMRNLKHQVYSGEFFCLPRVRDFHTEVFYEVGIFFPDPPMVVSPRARVSDITPDSLIF